MRPALLVVDIQNAWLDENEDLRRSVEKRVHTINQAIRWFRKNKLPIIVISHQDKKMGVVPGTRAFEFAKSIEVDRDDLAVTKRYPNSFWKTGLESLLRKRRCDTVVIVGLSASGCVMATLFGAVDRDLNAYFVKGGIASHSEDHVRVAEEIGDALKVEAFGRIFHKA